MKMLLLGALAVAALLPAPASADEPMRCEVMSTAQQTQLIELYTSEGCNSCPPADRWLSTLKGRPGVVAAAFHVDYWDSLGWKDRFASAAYSARQAENLSAAGARFSYTPQVLVNGRDWRQWPVLPASNVMAPVQIRLMREGGQRVVAQVQAMAGAPTTLAAWWALLEDGHVSAVNAGENRGVTLQHDHVVRAYGRQAAWSGTAPQRFGLAAPRHGEGGRAARLLFVVTDARGLPLQAVQLGC